jgi:hypothetical protein
MQIQVQPDKSSLQLGSAVELQVCCSAGTHQLLPSRHAAVSVVQQPLESSQ